MRACGSRERATRSDRIALVARRRARREHREPRRLPRHRRRRSAPRRGCATVRASAWSHPLGIPMPAIGIAFFAAMIVLAFVAAAAAAHRARGRRCGRRRSASIALQAFVDRRVVQALPGRRSRGDRRRASPSLAGARTLRLDVARARPSCPARSLVVLGARSVDAPAKRRRARRRPRRRASRSPAWSRSSSSSTSSARSAARSTRSSPRRSRSDARPGPRRAQDGAAADASARGAGRDRLVLRRCAGPRRRDGRGAVRGAAREAHARRLRRARRAGRLRLSKYRETFASAELRARQSPRDMADARAADLARLSDDLHRHASGSKAATTRAATLLAAIERAAR